MFSKMSRYRDREGSSDLLDTHYTRGKQYISITPTAVRNMFHIPLGGQRWFPIVPCLSLAPGLLSCHFPHFYFFSTLHGNSKFIYRIWHTQIFSKLASYLQTNRAICCTRSCSFCCCLFGSSFAFVPETKCGNHIRFFL